jgi:hypothetical protein
MCQPPTFDGVPMGLTHARERLSRHTTVATRVLGVRALKRHRRLPAVEVPHADFAWPAEFGALHDCMHMQSFACVGHAPLAPFRVMTHAPTSITSADAHGRVSRSDLRTWAVQAHSLRSQSITRVSARTQENKLTKPKHSACASDTERWTTC